MARVHPSAAAAAALLFVCAVLQRSYAMPAAQGTQQSRARGCAGFHFLLWSAPRRANSANLVLNAVATSERVQRLRDLSLTREVRNDLTSAEFALKVMPTGNQTLEQKIDFEKLVGRLEKNLKQLSQRKTRIRQVYGDEVDVLMARLAATREELKRVRSEMKNLAPFVDSQRFEEGADDGSSIKSLLRVREENPLQVFVREDGTVDWDGAIASAKEVAVFGSELWERLNGKKPEEGTIKAQMADKSEAPVNPKESFGSRTSSRQCTVSELQARLSDAGLQRLSLRDNIRVKKREGARLSSELSELRHLDGLVSDLEKQLKLYQLDLDMERICVYMEQELDQTASPSDSRLLIAEIGLVDAQLKAMLRYLEPADEAFSKLNSAHQTKTVDVEDEPSTLSLINDDELSVVAAEVADLKQRLGLDSPDTNLPVRIDWSSVRSFSQDSLEKFKEGFSFCVEGTKMLAQDVQYAGWLITKAARGYTLKPREVRTLRRSGKDLLTLIPFTIILLVPLSPVGHVLVFSFIQRYFPDFFPSPFTDRRQNLKKMYQEIEKRDEEWESDSDNDFDFDLRKWFGTKP